MRSVSRVHWLLHHLPSWFKRIYTLSFDYRYHQYFFYRIEKGILIDCFIVVRTSKRCFRYMYCNLIHSHFLYRSFNTSRKCALSIIDICAPYICPYI